MVAVDNTFLTLMLHPKARPPLDPATGSALQHVEERIELLIERLETDAEEVIIPVPVLTEFLMLADRDGPKYLAEIHAIHLFKIEPFDERAAIELARMNLQFRSRISKRARKREEAQGPWSKINFDHQIVAIAKVNNAGVIYSDDADVERFAKPHGISVVRTWELPLPKAKQRELDFEGAETKNAEDSK